MDLINVVERSAHSPQWPLNCKERRPPTRKRLSQLGLFTGKYFTRHCHNQLPVQTRQKVVSVRLEFNQLIKTEKIKNRRFLSKEKGEL